MIAFDALLEIAGYSLVVSLAVGAVAAVVLRRSRRQRVTVSVSVVLVSAIVSVILGVLTVSWRMFLSPHDLRVALVVVACAALVSTVIAWWLARGLRRDAVWADEMRRQERLMELSRRELVAWVSHDLRTPLAGIRAMAEALEDGVVRQHDEVAEYHRRLRQEADRMSSLVDDLFELSRIHAGALRVSTGTVDLAEVLSDAIASTAPLAQASGVVLTSEPLAATPVVGSEAELGRIARNLLVNAIRFTPSEGTVAVQAGSGDGTAWFAVSDGCGGIPTEDLPRVFDVAFRGEQARSKEPGVTGGGLGLAIARGLVEAHRGNIDIRNVDRGCRITVQIPATP
ncbi:MAG TPA: HAMP domain-containing sensor histidine kinase [Dermatophilaceae bacterium]|nr:HAMP domain-containing sensor histidine kinase [Dermatophilaceae bacterium]